MECGYLAHSFILRQVVRKWQKQIESKYNVKFINPFYRNRWEMKQVEKMEKLPQKLQDKGFPNWNITDCLRIMEEDLNLISQSDYMIALFDNPSIGTCQEIFAAAYIYNIPVYIITDKYKSHPWLRALSHLSNGKIFKDMIEFTKWLDKEGLKK